MNGTPFSVETNIYTTSIIGSFGRHQIKWRFTKGEAGVHSQNEVTDLHKGQLSSSAINEIESIDITVLDPSTAVILTQAKSSFHHYIRKNRRQCKDYIDTLKKAATLAGEEIKAHHLPYKFFFFKRNGEAFLDLIKLDKYGRQTGIITKNVTKDDFDKLIDDVRDGKGMYIDSVG